MPIKGKGTPCKIVYDIRLDEVTVSDHSSSDNVPVGDIRLRKACSGPVIGTFTASLTANLHLHELWALCISNGGFAGGCTAGTNIYASPGHHLLQSNGVADVSWPVVTARWVWPLVPAGEWRFRVLPAANTPTHPSVIVKNSTFTVEAFTR